MASKIAEEQRRLNNERAWQELSGYQTSSGCPCVDKSVNICIPKSSFGYGYTINCWALCCCYLCHKPIDTIYRPMKTWVVFLLVFVALAMIAGGLAMAYALSASCDGYHDSSYYYDYTCYFDNTTVDEKYCCRQPCNVPDDENVCKTLEELGGNITFIMGIFVSALGLVILLFSSVTMVQYVRHKKQQEKQQQVPNASLLTGQAEPPKYTV